MSPELKYTNDTMLLCVFDTLKKPAKDLKDATKKWGLKKNVGESKFLSECNRSIDIDGLLIEHVQTFRYLGSIVPDKHTDIKYHVSLAA